MANSIYFNKSVDDAIAICIHIYKLYHITITIKQAQDHPCYEIHEPSGMKQTQIAILVKFIPLKAIEEGNKSQIMTTTIARTNNRWFLKRGK